MKGRNTTTNIDNFSEYSYSRLLKVLDEWYDTDVEGTNYAQVLLGMENSTNIEDCFKIYNKVYQKYMTYLNISSKDGHKDFDEDLNSCLNENMLRILQQMSNPDNYIALKCLANLRQCEGLQAQQMQWKSIVSQKHMNILNSTVESITDAQQKYESARDEYLYGYFSKSSNAYKRIKSTIASNLNLLQSYGYKRVSKIISDNLNILKSYGYEVLPTDVNFSIRSNFQMFLIYLGCFGLFALFIAFCYMLSFASDTTISIIVLLIMGGGYVLIELRNNGKI